MAISRRELLSCSLPLVGAAFLAPRAVWAAVTGNTQLTGAIRPVHDPCIIRESDTYYVFSTGWIDSATGALPWRSSKDLVSWTARGSVFPAIPHWAQTAIPNMPGIWAPDISFFNDEYHLYYSCSTVGSNLSAIGLATNATLDPASPHHEWQDHGCVFMSQPGDDFNAIDANHVEDRARNHWLCFGSFWSGIKLIALDPVTGKPPAGPKSIHSLATRPVPVGAPDAIEAPFIIERAGAYYLFVSFDYCCNSSWSNYYLVVGRSADILGPYVDQNGKPMLAGYGRLLLKGDRRYRGPGHCAVLRDDDRDYLVYHAYDTQLSGEPVLRISPMTWTADGWPIVAT
jgi:arabinan endo-1,5-alpha-L-arabinosidase